MHLLGLLAHLGLGDLLGVRLAQLRLALGHDDRMPRAPRHKLEREPAMLEHGLAPLHHARVLQRGVVRLLLLALALGAHEEQPLQPRLVLTPQRAVAEQVEPRDHPPPLPLDDRLLQAAHLRARETRAFGFTGGPVGIDGGRAVTSAHAAAGGARSHQRMPRL